MKKILMLISMTFITGISYTDELPDVGTDIGTVVAESVCGDSNLIIESENGLFIPISHHSGFFLYEGETITGDFFTSGYGDVFDNSNRKGVYLVNDYEETLEEAKKVHCE